MTAPHATALATPINLGSAARASTDGLAQSLHPAYREAVHRLPAGPTVLRGLPFAFAPADASSRWLLLDGPAEIDLREAWREGVSHLVFAHFSDAWRDPVSGRPADLPIGWVTPVGQPLARYTVEGPGGTVVERVIRRRFEVNDGIVGWGQGAFAAVAHPVDQPLDWRGPHPVPPPGGYAAPGEAGLLGILPGSWGPDQTGVADSVPSPTGDIAFWLFALQIPPDAGPMERLRLEPLASIEEGGGVVVGAVTAFRGTASPLAIQPRRTLRFETPDGDGLEVGVDLGQVFRRRSAPERGHGGGGDGAPDGILGWGTPREEVGRGRGVLIDLAVAPDATLAIGSSAQVAAGELPNEGERRTSAGVTIEALPTPTRRVEVEVVDAATGRPMPARVRFVAPDGRYLPPLGHRDEVNPWLNEDEGADVVLGGATYAYVPGRFPIALPPGPVRMEVVHGFSHRPVHRTVDVDGGRAPLVVPLEPVDAGGWTAVDGHVHFISPTSALLQARAEGVAIVNLLATQWGDHHTSLSDLPAKVVADTDGEHLVVMGSENRQNMLGHIGLLGASDPVLPMASAGPPEARMGDPLEWLMRDWADASRAQDGLAVAVHFPLPYAEIAADIVCGRIDAVELQALTPGVDGPSIREWYRFLACGYRLPVVGGTDKMSAEVPVGAIRTYARLDPEQPLSFAAFAEAVRAGRTFVSSGALIDIEVDGHGQGDVVAFGPRGGTVEVKVRAWAAQPFIDTIELIQDGRVVATSGDGGPTDRLELSERVTVSASGWLAARATSRAFIHSAFSTSMGAHSSPVYVDVGGRRPYSAEDAQMIATIIDGARTWVETIAAVRSTDERARLAEYFTSSRATLDDLGRAGPTS
ncbi:MAG TPA: CehA/McbA family metallohydrolase [Candidatus Limnocylindrales bacterium]|nr:CehA/McbA family metallohydrolase [Candidatus Limnocylindrales bacterium]